MRTRAGAAALAVTLLAVLLTGVGLWRGTGGPNQAETLAKSTDAKVVPVQRGTEETFMAWISAATSFDKRKLRAVDSWKEAECNAVVVFLRDEQGVVWTWYDLKLGHTVRDLKGEEIWQAVQQRLDVEPDAETWRLRRGDAGGRPHYYLGHLWENGERVWLDLRTERCSFLEPRVQVEGHKPGEGPWLDIGKEVRTVYGEAYPGPPMVRFAPEGEVAIEAAMEATGYTTNVSIASWYEPECEGVAVLLEPLEEPQVGILLWYDLKTGRLTESITHLDYMQAAQNQGVVDHVKPLIWGWQDERGRPRFWLGRNETSENVWIHPGAQLCGLSHPQVEIAWDRDVPGRFLPLELLTDPKQLQFGPPEQMQSGNSQDSATSDQGAAPAGMLQ